jgi:mRNA interferase RelE/StbE
MATRILKKLEQVLGNDPDAGEPLVGEFKGCFKYRIGAYRIIYTKMPEGVLVLRIGHRKEVYR